MLSKSDDVTPKATIIITSGSTTYIAEAAPGTLDTVAEWRCQAIAAISGGTRIKWADGDTNFNNIPGADGAGLSALTYS